MSEPDFYYTIEKPSIAEYKERGSKFIAYAFPLDTASSFKNQLQQLKKEHPKAEHHCFAYRIGIDGNNFRSSDDGEPSGSAGKPILGQLDSKQITNTSIVVVRYFGGSLLGVPGLINAYRTAAAIALQLTPIVQKQVETNYTIQFDYTQVNEIMMLLKQYQCSIVRQEMQLFCAITAGIPKRSLQDVLYKLKELQNVIVEKAI